MKENQPITAPCQKRGASGNLKFCAFNYLCGDLTVLCSESPAFVKPQNVMPHCKKTANPKMAHLVLRIPSSKKTLNKHSRLLENKSVIKNRTMELEQIKKSILEIRGKKVMLDMDLAII